jgi:hypothetical protein
MSKYESKGTNIAREDDYVKPGVVAEFGADFKPLPMAESYYPTRLEYFAGKALQGMVTGRAEKDLKHAAAKALVLAQDMEDAIDSAQD